MIAIGSGSAVSVLDAWLGQHPQERGAVVEKDAPGGICLTRGCIPSKLLIASAEVARTVQRAAEFGVEIRGVSIDFGRVMHRMREHIDSEIAAIREGLSHAPNVDFYPVPAEFVGPSTLKVGSETIHAPRILLGLGSQPIIPTVPGLAGSGFWTSDTVFQATARPDRLAILGGGYIAAEFAHFFSAMGTQVTVIGRNPRFLPLEDPEISHVVSQVLGRRIQLLTGRQVESVELARRGEKRLTLAPGGEQMRVDVDQILVATGRGPTSALLHPERSGVKTDPQGWVVVNEFLETSAPGIWAMGDATGRLPFKHKANHDAKVLYENLVLGRKVAVDYHAVPHAVFTEPEVASVGLSEEGAIASVGAERLLIGRCPYRETAKGEAIGEADGFVKVLAEADRRRILGAHIAGPHSSVLLQEVVNLLYTPAQSFQPIFDGMHIHPALSEVVERAVLRLRPYAAVAGHVHTHAA